MGASEGVLTCAQGGIKRGGSVGRLSRNSSFAAEVGKINRELARGGSLVFDIEAQAQRHNSLPSHTEVPHSAPARHSTLPLQLASVPSQGRRA